MKKNNYFDKYIQEKSFYSCSGLSKVEILEKTKLYSLPFPKMYLDFLEVAGKEFNSYMEFRWGFEGICGNNDDLEDFARFVGKNITLDSLNVVFWSGESNYKFFNLKEGDNPPIYIYSIFQSEKAPKKLTSSFTDFIDHLVYKKTLGNVITYDPILSKTLERKEGLLPFDENNLPYIDKIQVSSAVMEKVSELFKGEEAKVVKMIVLDLAKEKARFVYDQPDFFYKLIESSKGNFLKLTRYYTLVIRDFDNPPIPNVFFLDKEIPLDDKANLTTEESATFPSIEESEFP